MRFGFALPCLFLAATGVAHADPTAASNLSVSAVATQPEQRARPSSEEVARLRKIVGESPRLREPHFALTRALIASGDLVSAHDEAASWREHDAYNLVVVRLLGDIEAEQGDTARARRTYSSIVELLPRDMQARRALATVLKQAGDLQGARQQLLAALEIGN